MVHSYAGTIFDPKCQGAFTQRSRSYRWWAPGIKVREPRIEQFVVTKEELLKAVPIIRV